MGMQRAGYEVRRRLMQIKNLTLGLCLLLSGTCLAQHQTYRIKEGDTLSDIAGKFHIRTHALAKANDLSGDNPLKVGRVLSIPSATVASDFGSGHKVPGFTGGYVVRDGENDWIIAHRHHLTTHQLHLFNPSVDWSAIHPGLHLRTSSSQSAVASGNPSHKQALTAAHKIKSTVVANKSSKKSAPSGRIYAVKSGENDWIIAHRVGVTTVALRKVNPGVNLSQLHAGQKIRVPGNAVVKVAAAHRLHSRYAVVNGDDVNIRREPNTDSDTVTQVDAGTRVVVLDRDGDWYRLRFPHGSEGWIRGGLLKAVSAPHVARRRRDDDDDEPEQRVASRSHRHQIVASRHGSRHSASNSGGSSEALAMDLPADEETGGKILNNVKHFRNARYHWGSMSRSATDCSGFTSQVFKEAGYRLPRTSREQSQAGIPVHEKDLKPGDLVFFHTMRGARVTHVGIYVGKGKFVHASSAGGHVQVNSLNGGYYKQRLVGARRVARSHKAHSEPVKHEPSVNDPMPPLDASADPK